MVSTYIAINNIFSGLIVNGSRTNSVTSLEMAKSSNLTEKSSLDCVMNFFIFSVTLTETVFNVLKCSSLPDNESAWNRSSLFPKASSFPLYPLLCCYRLSAFKWENMSAKNATLHMYSLSCMMFRWLAAPFELPQKIHILIPEFKAMRSKTFTLLSQSTSLWRKRLSWLQWLEIPAQICGTGNVRTWIPSDDVNYLHCFVHNLFQIPTYFGTQHALVNETMKCICFGSDILNSAHQTPVFANHVRSTICDG